MDESRHYDVVIIGGGPGGYAAALYGAGIGLRIALIEKDKVGGTCLHRGCIPAKEMLETAAVRRTILHAADFGINTSEPTIDWGRALERKQMVIDRMHGGLQQLLKSRKVDVFDGYGSLHAGRTVRVQLAGGGEETLTGDAVILATGSTPRVIPGFEPDGRLVVTSDEFFHIERVPQRAVVIGGGAIGCEFATTLADLGAEVTILEALPKILQGCDEDVTRSVGQAFKKKGITVKAGTAVTGHRPNGDTTTVTFDGGEIECDLVVVSVGRVPFTGKLGLDGTGVQVSDRGHIVVDEQCRTEEPGVWAIGDVINTPQLAHIGFAEGMLAIRDILGENPVPIDYSRVPWAIYCNPEVAFAGHSEESAKAAGFNVVTEKHRFIANGRAQIVGEPDGLVKIIAEKGADGRAGRILGVHMVGPWVTEQLGQGYLAVNWEATVDEVAAFIQPHPSLSETFGETVQALTGRSLH